ncbi:MAG: Tex-like N-terminal domain-containing protein [Planctomycetota bacterium]
MSAAAIVQTLAKEFAVGVEHAQRVLELLQAGNKAPYIARFRRSEIGDFTDGSIRRFARRVKQLEELDKRRTSLLGIIEEQCKAAGVQYTLPSEVEFCMDRFELEDYFLPLRRAEPEVQLALDRGLEALAEALVAPAPRGAGESEPEVPIEAPVEPQTEPAAEPAAEAPAEGVAEAVGEASSPSELAAELEAESAPSEESSAPEAEESGEASAPAPEPAPSRPAFHPARIDLSPQLARLCAQYVSPDRGVHTEEQALEGAMRILADRLGRNPALRTQLRRQLRKHGRVSVRAIVDEARLGKNRSLLRTNLPLKQLQGHRLIGLRLAQAQRQVALLITIDEKLVLPRVREALGRRIHPDYASVASEVARAALHLRLLPMIEDDVRNELRERADEEATRLVSQHLRQILLSPPAGTRAAAGVHIDAKGDWVLVQVDGDGTPLGAEAKLEASSLALPELAAKLAETMKGSQAQALAVSSAKGARPGLQKLREVVRLLGVDAAVVPVNDAGLSGYANSELARNELATFSIPAREAVSLARRFQDPLPEFLKIEARHLGLGREQLVIGKAGLRRVVHDALESCTAFLGCDLNRAGVHFLRHVPGLNFELAKKIVERRATRPFTSREELRTEKLLDDLAWINAIGFLRVEGSSEPLDATALHPELYDLVRRVVHQGGASVEETLGQRDAARGLRRVDFELDEYTWRDLVRELSHPGRDPRLRQFLPHLLAPDTDPKSLVKDQVVEGIVSSVASFGAFVDIGLAKDAMIHVSEVSNHYVRDARVQLSVGQFVRARVTDPSGQRLELSLKNVPEFKRGPRPERGPRAEGDGQSASGGEGGEGGRGRGGRRGGRREQGGEGWNEHQPVLRAARTRRDGLVPGKGKDERRGGRGGGGSGGFGRGEGRGGGKRPERAREEYDADAIRKASRATTSYNPFANFFKGKPDEKGASENGAGPAPAAE